MNKKIAVLFSGGSDSTLAAELALRSYDEVHLITYFHSFMLFHEKIEKNIIKLQELHPKKKIVRYTESINKKIKEYFFDNILKDIGHFGTIYTSWICGACKVAMHVTTLSYCLKNGITHVYCGANQESEGIFPAQMEQNIDSVKKFYALWGIEYETPVFKIAKTDKQLYDLGIIDNPNLKNQTLIYSTQHTCPLGIILHAHSRLYYKRIWGKEKYMRKSSELFSLKLERIKNRIIT